jgi:hypothetical protein
MIKYLPKTKMFLTFCIEWDLKVWRVDNKLKKHEVLHTFRLHRDIDFIRVFNQPQGPSDYDRFLMVFKTGESELFEYNSKDDALFYV